MKMINKLKNNFDSKGFALPLVLLVIALLLVGGGYFAYQKGLIPSNLVDKLTGQKTLPPPNVDVRPGNELPDAQVTITDKGFEPQTIMIRKGQRVSWQNNDTKDHRIVPDSLASFSDLADTEAIGPGEVIAFPFDKQGTFGIHDANNSALKATVIVKF